MALNPNSLAPVLRRSIDCIESFMDDLRRDSDGYGQCEDLIADLRALLESVGGEAALDRFDRMKEAA